MEVVQGNEENWSQILFIPKKDSPRGPDPNANQGNWGSRVTHTYFLLSFHIPVHCHIVRSAVSTFFYFQILKGKLKRLHIRSRVNNKLPDLWLSREIWLFNFPNLPLDEKVKGTFRSGLNYLGKDATGQAPKPSETSKLPNTGWM